MKLIFLAALSLIYFVGAADHWLFKTCEQSSFCRRCRNVTGPSTYNVDLSTLYTDTSGITVQIRNAENPKPFVLKLEALQDNTFHFEIDETDPLKPRYRVTEALNQSPIYDVADVSISSTEITVKSKSNKAVVKLSPFQIDFYQNEVHSLTVNGKGLLRFEHLREKPLTPDPTEEEGIWEEMFLDQIDSKPNGPEAVAVDFTFPQSEILFGIPQHADSFALRSTVDDEPYRLYTLDVTFYELDSRMPTYGAIPVIYSHGPKRTAGVFWHNSADTFVDIHDTKTAHFISEAGIIDVFVLLGPTPNEAFSQYTKLTGVTNLPQTFSLGYHQSRWNYMTQEELIEVVDKFDENDLPLDTVWLDIEYTDGKRYFTWNHETFSEPIEMIQNLTDTGRHLTYIIDPHIKKDIDYFFYRENSQRDYFVKSSNGSDYEGECWPGMSSYVDYFNPEARRHYADQFLMENFPENSIDTGIWNDMNEPVVFDVPEKTMPKDNLHYGGLEHRNVHSQYALMQVKGTFDGMMRRANGQLRPFILTRAFFSGTQRYSAVWTGDNGAEWGYLEASIKMCLSTSVAGISFCGSDIGGFFGDPDAELQVRWFQAAAYQPFFRGHASFDSLPREPYRLPEHEMSIVRAALRRRYELLPMWYTMFFEHECDGSPVMRPMLSGYPLDVNAFKLDDQYLLGDKLLVRPVMQNATTEVNVYFPSTDGDKKGEIWYDVDDYSKIDAVGYKSIEAKDTKIPVYQRGGSIIPRKETVRKSSVWMRDDPVSLIVAVDADEMATGTLYIDDEMSYDYRRGKYLYMKFELKNSTITGQLIDQDAKYETKSVLDRILIAGLNETPSHATLSSGGRTKRLEIVTATENFFVIEKAEVNMGEEWKIDLAFSLSPSDTSTTTDTSTTLTTPDGATQNVVSVILLSLLVVLNFSKTL